MPIHLENFAHYPAGWLSEPLADFLNADERTALDVMSFSFGFEVTHAYRFWESLVARILAGETTNDRCRWDVELPYAGHVVRVEVKYSREFECRFTTGVRPILKFAAPKGAGPEKPAHVLVLVGVDDKHAVYTWAIPGIAVRQCRSITLTSPRVRQGESRSRGIDGYRCPPTQLLPEVLRAFRSHLAHDAAHHAATRARTRHEQQTAGMDALFPLDQEETADGA
ncbi:hypothetical protein GCM10010402_66380 [Actinomadura luteofluorescens]|nr:hypothetical protein [Actinomadura glauciflava]